MGGDNLVEDETNDISGLKKTIDGSEEMMENLREYCFYKVFSDQKDGGETLFFNYIEKMHQLC